MHNLVTLKLGTLIFGTPMVGIHCEFVELSTIIDVERLICCHAYNVNCLCESSKICKMANHLKASVTSFRTQSLFDCVSNDSNIFLYFDGICILE